MNINNTNNNSATNLTSMDPPKSQPRGSSRLSIFQNPVQISQLLRISGEKRFQNENSLWTHTNKTYSIDDDSEDAFATPFEDVDNCFDEGGNPSNNCDEVSQKSLDIAISSLVQKCDHPPPLQLFEHSPSQIPVSTLFSELEQLRSSSDTFTFSTVLQRNEPQNVKKVSHLTSALTGLTMS
eukprot:c14995_g1_i2.p1 GENE.c14995_g1_i2~~c14995_g1_i2.p1  ORF type:complete len:181 (+),score=70.09 c14995_g1_i2:90-632(+)